MPQRFVDAQLKPEAICERWPNQGATQVVVLASGDLCNYGIGCLFMRTFCTRKLNVFIECFPSIHVAWSLV